MTDTTRAAHAEALRQALRRAYNYGQTYWQQADSELSTDHRRADKTQERFVTFVEETVATLTSSVNAIDAARAKEGKA